MKKDKDKKPVKSGKNQVMRDKKGRFIKGSSGNPLGAGAGRPEGSISITTEIKKKLKQIPKGEKRTYLEALILKILKKAIVDEDSRMIKNIWNYIDGMPKQEIEGKLELPVRIIHVKKAEPKK